MATKTDGWNSRFLEYAAANGRTPEAQLAADALRYPGGRMCGFIAWVTSRSTVAS